MIIVNITTFQTIPPVPKNVSNLPGLSGNPDLYIFSLQNQSMMLEIKQDNIPMMKYKLRFFLVDDANKDPNTKNPKPTKNTMYSNNVLENVKLTNDDIINEQINVYIIQVILESFSFLMNW
jgi:hypothetical protein